MKTLNNKKRISMLLIAAMLISIVAGIFASNGKSTFPMCPAATGLIPMWSELPKMAGYPV